MSKNIRIRTEPNKGDSKVKIQLNQDFDFLEILSLKISQEDVYRNFYSDYGVVVGRVIMNGGVGVPNARVSIFIPLTDDDAQNGEISKLYPYSDISIVNSDGIRYNILPEESQGICHTPVGTFPTKNKLIDNELLLDIYEKYYKYTTTTNNSGDFMLFGVPLGNHTLNVDVDLSDIGIYSQRPYDFIEQGNPSKLFESPTKFKSGNNLNNLTQLKNRQVGINVIPFWGEKVSNEVGISRVDIDLNYTLEPKAIFIGSIFGDNEKNSINKNCRPRKKLGKVCEMGEGGGTIQMLRKTLHGENERFDIEGGRVINDNGVWAYQIPMNLDYMVTDEYGKLIKTEDTNKGIPTRSRLRFKIDTDVTGGDGRLRTRAKYLVPNNPRINNEIDYTFDERTSDIHFRNFYWNKIYTIKNFISRFQPNESLSNRNFVGFKDVDDCVGVKNPIPFNTLDTDLNPLYIILCLIMGLIIGIVGAINTVIHAVNKVPIVHLGLISITCPIDGSVHKPRKKSSIKAAKTCFQLSLAEALGVFEFDFYNDWINGSLYAFLLKYKKKNNDEKFCGDGVGDGNNYLLSTTEPKNDIKHETKVKLDDEGIIVSHESELFYKPITKHGNLLNATDIYNLGSVFDCDWQGKPNVHTNLLSTSYKLPPLTVDDKNSIENPTTLDPLLFDIDCDGVSANPSRSINIRRLCEIGVGLDVDSNKNNGIDGDDINDNLLRNNLIKLNNEQLSDKLVDDISSFFKSGDYVTYRGSNKKNGMSQPFEDSFYFYFGTIPNKSSLDLMNSKYFTTCYKHIDNPIKINGNVTNITIAGSNDGEIEIIVNGGSKPYKYVWLNSLGEEIAIDTTIISNLAKGLYTVIVTDDNLSTNSKNFNVGGISELQMTVTNRGSLPNVNGDGIIYITGIGGGVGPYDIEITGGSGGGPYTYSGIYGGVTIKNLQSSSYPYVVSCTDYNGTTITGETTINEIGVLTITNIITTPISCNDADDGVITFDISQGTPPYVIELTDINGNTYSTDEITGLQDGDYQLKVYDSYSQSATIPTITIDNVLPLELASSISGSAHTLTLTNTIVGTTYNLNKNGIFETAIVANASILTYVTSNSGSYEFGTENGCYSNEITI